MKEKHRKSLGFGIHTHIHTRTCTRGVLFSVHRCWYALHDQIVCKSVQKVTVRFWVREDPGASGATRTGQAELTNSRRQMLRDTKGWGGCWWGGGGIYRLEHIPSRDAGSQHASECTYEAQAAQLCGAPRSLRWLPLPRSLPSAPRLPHYQIYAACSAMSDVICAELQMLADWWGCVLKTLLCCDEALFTERLTIRDLV